MKLLLVLFSTLAFAAGCAVSTNSYISTEEPELESVSERIIGDFEIDVQNPSALTIQAKVLGVTCSAVDTIGDFQDRFSKVSTAAMEPVFDVNSQGETYLIEITLSPQTPTIMQLRRSYLSGVARVRFAMGADVLVTAPEGAQTSFSVATDETKVEVELEPTGTCSSNGQGLADAFEASTIELVKILRTKLIDKFAESRS